MDDIQSNGNVGLDTRPSMQLTLRLREPKRQNQLYFIMVYKIN
jgi:hypothetical protein